MQLETDRLILRPFLPEDAEDFLLYLQKSSVNCFMDMKLENLEEASAYFYLLFNQEGARRIYIYAEDYNIACQKLSEKLGMRQE